MTTADLHKLCQSLAGAVEQYPFGPTAAVYKVGGKMFALIGVDADPPSINLKCEPTLAEQLRDNYPAIQPGYHMNKRHWNTVTVDQSIPDSMVREMVEDSYDLVFESLPARVRTQITG